jgi:hypothetical protein
MKFLDPNESENTTYQNLWDTVKTDIINYAPIGNNCTMRKVFLTNSGIFN